MKMKSCGVDCKKKSWITIFLIGILFMGLLPNKVLAAVSSQQGIDISYHNGEIDWEQIALNNIFFVMIKTGDGQEPKNFETDKDSQFEANYSGAESAGIKRGVYHLCCTRTPEGAVKEAEYCLKILDGRPLEYPIAYDMEQEGTFLGGKNNTTKIAKAFCEVIEKAGYTPMIYSTATHLKEDFDWDELKDYKVWVAHYDVEKADFERSYDIWQYTQTGNVEGANTNNGKGTCDLNYSFMEADRVTLNQKKTTIGTGESITLKASMKPAYTTDSITWSSDNKSIASVNQSGKITGKAKGTAVITAKTGSGEKAVCTITVKKAPTSIKLNAKEKTIKVGEIFQLKTTPSAGSASCKVTYTSANKAIASVNSKGLILANKKGSTYITVTTFNKKQAKIKVVVK